MKIKAKDAMIHLREAFLSRIFKGYPDHKKHWTAEEINSEFSSAMYDVVMDYLDELEK